MLAAEEHTDPATALQTGLLGQLQEAGSKFPCGINQMSNNTHSSYNSLQVTKRMSHGLSFIAGYTFAHGLDRFSQRFGLIRRLADQYADSISVRTLHRPHNIPGLRGYAQLLEGWRNPSSTSNFSALARDGSNSTAPTTMDLGIGNPPSVHSTQSPIARVASLQERPPEALAS
jgi:hypothetical protein